MWNNEQSDKYKYTTYTLSLSRAVVFIGILILTRYLYRCECACVCALCECWELLKELRSLATLIHIHTRLPLIHSFIHTWKCLRNWQFLFINREERRRTVPFLAPYECGWYVCMYVRVCVCGLRESQWRKKKIWNDNSNEKNLLHRRFDFCYAACAQWRLVLMRTHEWIDINGKWTKKQSRRENSPHSMATAASTLESSSTSKICLFLWCIFLFGFFKIAHTHFMLPLKTKYFHNSQKIDKDATHARTHKQLRAAKYYTPTKMFFNFSLNHFTNSRSIFSFTLSPSLGAAFVCNISIRSGGFFSIVIFAHWNARCCWFFAAIACCCR